MRFQTSPCFKICKRSPSTARISVAESKSSSESRLLASRYPEPPTCFVVFVFAVCGVEEQPVVRPDAAVPMLDSQLAAFSLLATYWTSRKHIATWILWVFVDIVYVGMFIYKDLYLTAGLYAAFVLMAAFGWWQWEQVKRKQQTKLVI